MLLFCSVFLKTHRIPARTIHEASTVAADPGMSTALRSLGLLDVLSSTPAGPSVARLVSMPACAASLRIFMNNAGQLSVYHSARIVSSGAAIRINDVLLNLLDAA